MQMLTSASRGAGRREPGEYRDALERKSIEVRKMHVWIRRRRVTLKRQGVEIVKADEFK